MKMFEKRIKEYFCEIIFKIGCEASIYYWNVNFHIYIYLNK